MVMEDYDARWPEIEILTAQKTRECGISKPIIVIHELCRKHIDITGLDIGKSHAWGNKTKTIFCNACG